MSSDWGVALIIKKANSNTVDMDMPSTLGIIVG
jgi:hypothetical protein